MRRIYQLSMLCFAAGAGFACKPETVIETEAIPTAGVRFINAVPDTGQMDFRPVDIVENTTFYNVGFRGTTVLYYKNARAGTRHFKIFRTPDQTTSAATQIAVAQTVVADLVDQVLEQDKRYTYILWGYSRTGSSPAMRVTLLTDDPPDPGTQVGVRVVNACVPGQICGAATDGVVDARVFTGTATIAAPAQTFTVQPLSASAYANVAASASSCVTTQAACYSFDFRPAGSSTAATALAAGNAPAGILQTIDLEAVPGTNVAGSAVSAIFVPGSVIGSTADQFVSTTTDSLAAVAATQSYTYRTTGTSLPSFITNGFRVGDVITVQGFANAANNGTALVTAVTASTLTVSKTPTLVDEARGVNNGATPPVLRSIRAPRAGVLFVWDRRPPRTCALCAPAQ